MQDMAQPQHVRDDAHCNVWYCENLEPFPYDFNQDNNIIYQPSLYEARANEAIVERGISLGTYPVPSLDDFMDVRDYWVHDECPSCDVGKGIAEFTSKNFISEDTNFVLDGLTVLPDQNHPLPSPARLSLSELVNIQDLRPGADLTGLVEFYSYDITDDLNPARSRPVYRYTSVSLFHDDLQRQGIFGFFSRRAFRFTTETAHAHLEELAPRAIAYSAGLIDYFFRARIDIEEVSVDGSTVTLAVRNVSEGDLALRSINGGDPFEVFYESLDGSRQSLGSFPLDTGELAHGATQSISFPVPDDLDPSAELSYVLVLDGEAGRERAVAVDTVRPAVPGFVMTPTALPPDGISGSRSIYFDGSNWQLDPGSGYRAGNIDWKGSYEGGVAQKVVSWAGPKMRYLPEVGRPDVFAANIFKDGDLHAVAPGLVLGAAISTDSAGQEWLVAVCQLGAEEKVFRRDATVRSTSPDLFDPVAAPDGWQEIGVIPQIAGMQGADTPWLFNGDGSEAQNLRFEVFVPDSRGVPIAYRHRYRITLQDVSSVSFADLGVAFDVAGQAPILGVDYVDNQEVFLRMDSGSPDSPWLNVEGEALVPNDLIKVMDYENQFAWSTSVVEYTGEIVASDYDETLSYGVYVSIYYLDIRENLVGLTISNNVGGFNTSGFGQNLIVQSGVPLATQSWSGAQGRYPGGTSYPQRTYFPWCGGTEGGYCPTDSFFNNGFSYPVTGGCAVDTRSKIFCSSLLQSESEYLNYLTGGNPLDVVGITEPGAGFEAIGVK